MTMRLVATIGALGLVLTGCATDPQNPAEQSISTQQDGSANTAGDLIAAHGLDGLTGQEIVNQLDNLSQAERPSSLFASVRANSLVLTDGGAQEQVVALPEDEFYVSIAPFLTQTHECYFHSLTSCVGELQNKDIQVRIVNDADGTVLVDEATKTFDNGFIGYWLPKDITATVEITHDGNTATATLGTGPDDPTCVTTIQLA